jgi:hypothetical protein
MWADIGSTLAVIAAAAVVVFVANIIGAWFAQRK